MGRSEEPSETGSQAPRALDRLVEYATGYGAIWTVELGRRWGLWQFLARSRGAATPEEIASRLDLSRRYVEVWCESALSVGLLERSGNSYTLPEDLRAPLVEPDSPAYFTGLARFLVAMSDPMERVAAHLADGKGAWWDQLPEELSEAVSDSSRTFYTRLLRKGFSRVPGLARRLAEPLTFVELACGRGEGLLRIARAHPALRCVGVDSSFRALEAARRRGSEALGGPAVEWVQASFESDPLPPGDVYLVNIALHEARDPARAVRNIFRFQRPGGLFLVSEFPYSRREEDLRTPSGRLMSFSEYLEALLGDTFHPMEFYEEILTAAGFEEVGSALLSRFHGLAWGTKPA
jgi:ubiquinone/menaquinone biosynthesis C-methylase UbiE